MSTSTQQNGGMGYPAPYSPTVRQLYATAFRCDEPECTKPLYRLNNETGDPNLNSRVCHIYLRDQVAPDGG